jgi:hypothetical protein
MRQRRELGLVISVRSLSHKRKENLVFGIAGRGGRGLFLVKESGGEKDI